MLRVLRMAADDGITAWGSPTRTSPIEDDLTGQIDATIHELGALAQYFLFGGASVVVPPDGPSSDATEFPLGDGRLAPYTVPKPAENRAPQGPEARSLRSLFRPCPSTEREPVKQAEEASFVDLIACERDCRTCSYAAALDCDGNCGVCPHNSYCPCVNPVVARSKTALRLIELRPILLQDLQARN